MNLLILGYSSLVERRVLPALRGAGIFERIDIATRSKTVPNTATDGAVFADYGRALEESSADVVYVSLVNSLHGEWVEKALSAGHHVVVDKPAFLERRTCRAMINLARERGVCLAEAVVFDYHPQMAVVLDYCDRYPITRIQACFSFPPLQEGNFRTLSGLGGGCLADQAPYAAALCRRIFKDHPREIIGRVLSRHPVSGVETALSVMALFEGGRSFLAHFGFDTEYQNHLTLIGPNISLSMDRVFTIPSDQRNTIEVTSGNKKTMITAPAGDMFVGFFGDLLRRIGDQRFGHFASNIIYDNEFLSDLVEASGGAQ